MASSDVVVFAAVVLVLAVLLTSLSEFSGARSFLKNFLLSLTGLCLLIGAGAWIGHALRIALDLDR
jgi:hypothetical protein